MQRKPRPNRSIKLLLLLTATLATKKIQAQWDIEESHTAASLRGIHNVGGGVAWASGTNGTVLRTEDGGYLWQTCTIPPGAEKLDFRGIQAFDENTAIVMSSGKGDLSRLYKTTDGCQTWKLLFTNPDKEGFWDAIKMTSRNIGMLIGDPVPRGHEIRYLSIQQRLPVFPTYYTADGGTTWKRDDHGILSAIADKNKKPGESIFAASNSSMLLIPNSMLFVTGVTKANSITASFPKGRFPRCARNGAQLRAPPNLLSRTVKLLAAFLSLQPQKARNWPQS